MVVLFFLMLVPIGITCRATLCVIQFENPRTHARAHTPPHTPKHRKHKETNRNIQQTLTKHTNQLKNTNKHVIRTNSIPGPLRDPKR